MKVAINTCFGGYGISQKAYLRLIELGVPVVEYTHDHNHNNQQVIFKGGLGPLMSEYWDTWIDDEENRSHPLIIQVIEELGTEANGDYAELSIVEIPDGVEYIIGDYDGVETIHENHRSWS